MGIINRVEHGLAKAVHGAFAKAFKSEVQPVEIASAIRRAMDDRAALLGHGRAMVPNLYTIELSETDYERLGDYEDELSEDLVAAAQEHADSQGYQPHGPLEVNLVEGEGLETGVFRVRPATSKRGGQEPAAGARRPAALEHRHGRRRAAGGPPSGPAQQPLVPSLARHRWRPLPPARQPDDPRSRRHRRHRRRRPGCLAAPQRDPRDDRRAAPHHLHPRPQLHQRHVRQRRAHLEPAPARR